jgi:hypothetical protein
MVAAPGMDGTATTGTGFPFLPLAAGRRGLALRCLRRFEAGTLLLFCGGIEVGRLALAEAAEAGRTVEVPVGRLPRVALPAELRLATDVAGPDLAPSWEIASADAAFGLLGPPAPVVESLRLDHGVLRGVATEKANGLLEPVLYARVNDAAARAVAVEAPAPLAEGGCVFRFAVPLQPADLVEAGLAVDVHMVGLEAPLARFALAPAGGVDTARVAELEGRLRRLEDAMASGLDAMEHALRRRMDAHGERVDAFIEASASLLLDRVAAGDAPTALRALVGGGAPPETADAAPLRLGNRVELPPDSGHLGFGWHLPERDAGGAFRWMADRALVVSPEPHRPLASVTLEVGHVYAAAEPALRAGFDALPCAVAVEREQGGRRFRVRIAPPDGAAAAPCRTLMLEALASGSPARDGASADARLLSVAVYRLVFDYAE